MTSPPDSISILSPGEVPTLGDVPQLYRTAAADALPMHELFHRAIRACVARWGSGQLIVQSQTVDVRPGSHPGIPVAQAVPLSASGEVAVACLGAHALLELDGAPCAPDALVFAPFGATWRFAASETDATVVVLLITPDDGAPLSSRARHCGRVFAPWPHVASHPLPEWAQRRELRFDSQLELHAPVLSFSQDEVAAEPMFAMASPQFLREHGGPIARAFVDALPHDWTGPDADVVVQVKRDELSPGWYPALINWHMDGTSRADKRADGTANLRAPGRKVDQLLVCVGPPSPTGMLIGELHLPEVPEGLPPGAAAGVWQRLLLDDLQAGTITQTAAPEGRLCGFGWGGFHTATRARAPGWRLFCKAMRGRGDAPRNERRARAQVTWALHHDDYPDDPCGVFPRV